MSTLYRDIKLGMNVEFWLNINANSKRGRKTEDDLLPESRDHGYGIVIFAGPHFITVKMSDGRKETISRNDIMDNHAQVRQVAILNRR